MQPVATYSDRDKENLEIFADLINRNDACGLANHLLQEQKHQMQNGGRLNYGKRNCDSSECSIIGGRMRCGFCTLDF